MSSPVQQTSDSHLDKEEDTLLQDCANDEQCEAEINDGDTWRNEVVEKFEIVKYITKGTYGRVWKIVEKSTGSFYALKVVSTQLRENDLFEESQILREKHILENLGYHPFLMEFHSAYVTPNHVALITGYIAGVVLIDYLDHMNCLTFPESHARFYIAEISFALHYLHKKGIIHRDLKANNVMIDTDGHIKLIDFGFAKDGLGFGSTTTTILYSGMYGSPEMFCASPVYTFAVDWYALGITLCMMVTRQHPFISIDEDESKEDFTDEEYASMVTAMVLNEPKFKRDNLSVETIDILERLLQPEPELRLGSGDTADRMEIGEHAFFRDIDWIELENKRIKPPFIPPSEETHT